MLSAPRQAPRRIVVAGSGTVGLIAAIALRRALPTCELVVLDLPADPAAFADTAATALPFTNWFHDRLGIDEAQLVRDAGASHRLVTRYSGWGGPTRSGTFAYGTGPDLEHDARFAAAGEASPGSLAARLAERGRFRAFPPSDSPALAGIDYALRWHPLAYRDVLARHASAIGVAIVPGDLERSDADDQDGLSAVVVAPGRRIVADLFIDASGPKARLLFALPGHRVEDWSARLPVRAVAVRQVPPTSIGLDDRVDLLPAGWRVAVNGRDASHLLLGIVPGVSSDTVAAALGGAPDAILPIAPGRAVAPWLGNVVAIGDAAVTVGPLGMPLDLAHRQLALLLELLPGRPIAAAERAEFNRRCALMAEGTADLVAVHHAAPAARAIFGPAALSESLGNALDQFTRRGAMPFEEELPMAASERISLFAALGFTMGRAAHMAPPDRPAAERLIAARTGAALADLPRYTDWLASLLPR